MWLFTLQAGGKGKQPYLYKRNHSVQEALFGTKDSLKNFLLFVTNVNSLFQWMLLKKTVNLFSVLFLQITDLSLE